MNGGGGGGIPHIGGQCLWCIGGPNMWRWHLRIQCIMLRIPRLPNSLTALHSLHLQVHLISSSFFSSAPSFEVSSESLSDFDGMCILWYPHGGPCIL